MPSDNNNIHTIYTFLLDILLSAEGDNTFTTQYHLLLKHYKQEKSLSIPSMLIPLLYAASNTVQMAVSFLPYYAQHHRLGNHVIDSDLIDTIIHNNAWFTQEIYPNLLKFLLSDSLRTVAITDFNDNSEQLKNDITQSIFLYDSECTLYPPFGGINIHNTPVFQSALFTISDSQKTLYFIGNISPSGLDILMKQNIKQPIYGISPCDKKEKQWQDYLYARLNFFSKTILAGSLNMQLPFIEHYFQAGISPISFYYLLYRSYYPNTIIKNALCLLNIKPIIKNITDYIPYSRLASHTDIQNNKDNDISVIKPTNYLTLLSLET